MLALDVMRTSFATIDPVQHCLMLSGYCGKPVSEACRCLTAPGL